MVAAPTVISTMQQIITLWQQLPHNHKEAGIEANFISPLLKSLGLNIQQIKHNPNLGTGAGLKPDYLVYQDINTAPKLVIEAKKRVSALATVPDGNFIAQCKAHPLYQNAVGYLGVGNGIKQYLDKSNNNINSNKLADYGLVINGDFFQLWRRVDGLIIPMTPIQRITTQTIPELIKQLKYCIFEKPKALVTGIWNRKGGVAKTTNTLNIASVLALHGKKVLLIDFDTQCDLTRALKLNPSDYQGYLGKSLAKVHAGKLDDAKLILENTIKSIDYLTSDRYSFSFNIFPGCAEDLEALSKGISDPKIDRELATITGLGRAGIIKVIKKMVQLLSENYDYIFIDNSPSIDNATLGILSSCDTVLIPCDYSKKTLHHAAYIENNVLPDIKSFNSKKEPINYKPLGIGLVFSNCPGNIKPDSQLEKCIQNELNTKKFNGKQYQTRLQIYAQTKLAEYKQKPVICWEKSRITKLYHELTEEIFLTHNFINY